jgi:hypothetical protein
MCVACLWNPFDVIKPIRTINTWDDKKKKQAEAMLLKAAIKRIDEEGRLQCDEGKEIIEEIKKRQYELAQEL